MMKRCGLLAIACAFLVLGGCTTTASQRQPERGTVDGDTASHEPETPKRPPPAIKL